MKRILFCLGLLLAATPATAADLYGHSSKDDGTSFHAATSWTGFYAGAGLTCGTGLHELDANLGGYATLNFDGIGFQGCGVVGQVGYDRQLGQLVVGVGADYEWSNAETTLDLASGGFAVHGELQKDTAWTVYGRAGILATPTTLLYGLAGFGQTEFGDASLTATGGFAASLPVPTFDTYTLGAGVEQRFGEHFALKLEYRHREYDGETLAEGAGFTVGIDPSEDAALLTAIIRQ